MCIRDRTKREDPLTGSKISPEDHNFAQPPGSRRREADTDGRIRVVTQYHLVGDRSEGAGEEEGAPFSVIGQGAARPGATGPARVHEKWDVVGNICTQSQYKHLHTVTIQTSAHSHHTDICTHHHTNICTQSQYKHLHSHHTDICTVSIQKSAQSLYKHLHTVTIQISAHSHHTYICTQSQYKHLDTVTIQTSAHSHHTNICT